VKEGHEKLPVTVVAIPFAPTPISCPSSFPDLRSALMVAEPLPLPVVQLPGLRPFLIRLRATVVPLAVAPNGRVPACSGGSRWIWIW
jgi:hypothetical protein